MALSQSMDWEIRASGAGVSDNNGGGFVAGASGTDYSQQNSPQLTVTDGVTTGTTTVTSVTGGFTSAMIGNVINIVGDGSYEIKTRSNTNTITVDRSTGTATGQTMNVGGAKLTLAAVAALYTFGNKMFATGAFTTTATITFATGGTPNGSQPHSFLIGYGSTRGDGVNATLTLQTNTGLTGLNPTGNGFIIESFDVDCASLGTSTGISMTSGFSNIRNCKVSNFTSKGINAQTGSKVIIRNCEVTGGTSAATTAIDNQSSGSVMDCFVHDNACAGIKVTGGGQANRNIVCNNSGASSDGITGAANDVRIQDNICHNNGRDGYRQSSGGPISIVVRNNLFTNNGGYGFSNQTASFPASPEWDGNFYYSNTSGTRFQLDSVTGVYNVVPYTNVLDVILTASPYVGGTTGASANFDLNNTAGGGAAVRAVGVPNRWPGNTGTTGYRDGGPVQHRDAGGLLVNPGTSGGMRG